MSGGVKILLLGGVVVTNFIKKGCSQDLLLKCLMETVHQGFTIFDEHLEILAVNETAMKILDIPYSIFEENSNLEDVFRFNAKRGDYGPGNPEDLVKARVEIALKFEAHDFERQRPDGTTIRIQGTPIANGGFVTIYSDVTHERAQEKELRDARRELADRLDDRTRQLKENRDLLFNAVNAIQDGLGIANSDGQVILANDRMKEIYPGFESCIEKGESVSEVIRSVFPEEPDRGVDVIMNSEVMWHEKKFPDGKWYRIDRTRSTDGGIISVYTDITEYKKQQANLQSHTDELVRLLQQEKELTEMQREFVSMASHEFRTPLAIIDSNAQRLIRKANDITPEKAISRSERIRDSVSRMQYLINRFLNFSQTQSKGIALEVQDQPFRDAVYKTCENFIESCPTHQVKVDIERLPGTYSYDQKLLDICVTNLLSNAVKYSPNANEVRLIGYLDGRHLIICVEDDGVGIPEDEIPKVFDRYFRASTSSGIAGTGIGLNWVAKVIEKHNGKIDVWSKVGEGSRITLKLPLQHVEHDQQRASVA
ncbi:PAS-domain containing protein [Roseibium sp.]|uniref:sensor histidine kinase n=1 Tax=Roseibium sp. TaxID=1936156 RepID=UPI0039F04EE7